MATVVRSKTIAVETMLGNASLYLENGAVICLSIDETIDINGTKYKIEQMQFIGTKNIYCPDAAISPCGNWQKTTDKISCLEIREAGKRMPIKYLSFMSMHEPVYKKMVQILLIFISDWLNTPLGKRTLEKNLLQSAIFGLCDLSRFKAQAKYATGLSELEIVAAIDATDLSDPDNLTGLDALLDEVVVYSSIQGTEVAEFKLLKKSLGGNAYCVQLLNDSSI